MNNIVQWFSKFTRKKTNFFKFFSGDSSIIWKESNRIISAGKIIIRKDDRLSLMDGYDLRIDNLEETDSGKRFYLKNQLNFKSNCTIFFSLLGTYVCEIETHGSPLHQTSQLEILGK